MLVEAGLLSLPVLYLSRYLIRHKSEYYARLLAVTSDGDWIGWVGFIVEGIRQTALFTLQKIAGIRDLQTLMHDSLRRTVSGAVNADLLAVLFEQPYCRISDVMHRCHVSRPTATKWLSALADGHVLESRRIRRERLFVNADFLALLQREEIVDGRLS